jgi:S-DNA-T family DNA segregation ATPase FtsK/SpoIIIE
LQENKFKNRLKKTDEDLVNESPFADDKQDLEPAGKKKTKPTSNSASVKVTKVKQFVQKISNFISDERTIKITGLFFVLFSIYAAVALVSYLFTWKEDQNVIYQKFIDITLDEDIAVQNWLGKTGAYLSHFLIHQTFGLSSFFLLPVFFIAGFKMLTGITLYNIKRTSYHLIFYTLWTCVLLGYIFDKQFFYVGGATGYFCAKWLTNVFGDIGTILFFILTLLSFIIIAYNPSFKLNSTNRLSNTLDDTEEKNQRPVSQEPLEKNVYKGKVADIEPVDKNNLHFEEPFLIKKDKTTDELNQEFILEETHGLDVDVPVEDPPKSSKTEPEFEIEQKTDNNPLTLDIANVVQHQVEQDRLSNLANNPEPTVNIEELGDYDPTLDLSNYQYPTIDLLKDYGGDKSIEINKIELEENKNRIVKTLGDYGISIAKIKASVGPTVTLYEIIPDAGVRISKIKNLEDDIALSLAALGIRIIAPMPGKGTIGIEVPNSKPDIVPMRYILDSDKFKNNNFELPIALGKTILNETFVTDLAKMPHLLMAGATGQGKSVGLNAILTSLLYKKHPAELKFVLVDPKKVELTLYNKIERHFLAKLPNSEEAIITDTKKVIHTLNSLCIEMDNRYELLKDAQVRNIKEYNAKFISRKLLPIHGHRFLPYIVLVIDEFADLIMTAGKEVEMPIARLAQLARAIGIHLIIATQRPSVNIITGTIKANFPARIAFRVSSKIDSRTILDTGGAEQLIGRGDMLLSTGNDLIRIQCAFVDTPEVEEICEFIGSQRAFPNAYELPEYIDENETSKKEDFDPAERDPFFEEAARLIVQTQQGSTSLIQRKLKLGYNRAGRIIDQLEAAGIVGPFEGSKARQVLIKDENSLEQLLNSLNH